MSGSVVTVGTFDGVHLGHRRILDRVEREARDRGAARIAYVFEHPPRMTLVPGFRPRLLLPVDLRIKLLRACVDRLEIARFSDVRDLSPAEFAERILASRLRAEVVVVGSGFCFGKDRAGRLSDLREAGDALGFEVCPVDPLLIGGLPVSSTRARNLLAGGEIPSAAELLGRPPILAGTATRGEGVGRKLGYPTANLRSDPETLLPADGIYLCYAFVDGRRERGLLYVGRRPTLAGTDRRCEVHLLKSEHAELYDHVIELHLLERLREDRTFPSLANLRAQIAEDVKEAAARFVRHPSDLGPVSG